MTSAGLEPLRAMLRERVVPGRAAAMARYMQAFPGGYGEGDRFLGIPVPGVREVVRAFRQTAPDVALDLVRSTWHEERLCGFLLWLEAWKGASRSGKEDEALQSRLVGLFLEHRRHADNWDLVDTTVPELPGKWWMLHPDPVLMDSLLGSESVWERRIAVLATFPEIRAGIFGNILERAERLLPDRHPLIHKAVGWMLREAGNRDPRPLRQFLADHSLAMPRTMLRYAIEKLPDAERRGWLER